MNTHLGPTVQSCISGAYEPPEAPVYIYAYYRVCKCYIISYMTEALAAVLIVQCTAPKWCDLRVSKMCRLTYLWRTAVPPDVIYSNRRHNSIHDVQSGRLLTQCAACKYLLMYARYSNSLANGSCSFAYWLFIAIIFERFENPHVRNEEKPKSAVHTLLRP